MLVWTGLYYYYVLQKFAQACSFLDLRFVFIFLIIFHGSNDTGKHFVPPDGRRRAGRDSWLHESLAMSLKLMRLCEMRWAKHQPTSVSICMSHHLTKQLGSPNSEPRKQRKAQHCDGLPEKKYSCENGATSFRIMIYRFQSIVGVWNIVS